MNERVVMTTVGSAEEARRIADKLVERKLAACVSIFPRIVSVYRWEGKLEHAEEWQLWAKTAVPFSQIRDAILEMHSYDLPECLSIAIEEGSREYLQWIRDATK